MSTQTSPIHSFRIAVVLLATLGCGRQESPTGTPGSAPPPTQLASPVETLQYDGRTWTATGEMSQALPIWLPAAVFTAGDPDERLLHVTDREAAGLAAREVFRMERRSGGEWVLHGTVEMFGANGDHDIDHYREGKRHGEQLRYGPDGKRRIRKEYDRGQLHGLWEMWHDNGQLMSRTHYEHDVEGATEAYHADGTPMKVIASQEPTKAEESAPDPGFMLNRLRDAVSGPAWAIAPSPATWSTLTVDVGESFSAQTAAQVWSTWTEPVTALTLKSNLQIKSEIEQAVAAARPGERPVEREFDAYGFRIVVTASNGTSADTTFVRISFMGAKYAP